MNTIIFCAGGTGGHIFPASSVLLQIKDKIVSCYRDQKLIFLTDERGSKFINSFSDEYTYFKIIVLKNTRLHYKYIGNFVINFFKIAKLFIQYRPKFLFCFGGIITVIPAFLAKILKIPVIIHEQNAVIGKANFLLYRYFAEKSFFAFRKPILSLQNNKILNKKNIKIYSGLPMRFHDGNIAKKLDISQISEKYAFFSNFNKKSVENNDINSENRLKSDIFTINNVEEKNKNFIFKLLISAGSQGSDFFDNNIPEIILNVLSNLPHSFLKYIQITEQVRSENVEKVYQKYQSSPIFQQIHFEMKPFFEDLPNRLETADLFIGRGGASTIFESLHCKIPSIFIPLKTAVLNHQFENVMEFHDYVDCVEEDNISNLNDLLRKYLFDPQILLEKKRKLYEIPEIDANEIILREISSYLV